MRNSIIIAVFALSVGLVSCTKKEVIDDLELSFYDPEFVGPNPYTVTGTEYVQIPLFDNNGFFIGYLDQAEIHFVFDESVLQPGQRYGARVDGDVIGTITNGVFTHTRDVTVGQTDYCSVVEFLDQLNRPVREYMNCYTVEF